MAAGGNGAILGPGLGCSRRSHRSIATSPQQDPGLILKDMMSARDEATPPAFKELVERYYEVLSNNGQPKVTMARVATRGAVSPARARIDRSGTGEDR